MGLDILFVGHYLGGGGVMAQFMVGRHRRRFEAIQKCLIPRARRFTEAQRESSIALVDDFLGSKPTWVRCQIYLFLVLIDVVSVFWGLRTFKNLSFKKQEKVMRWFFDCPVALFRKGFWGINTLAKMGVYGQEDFYPEIGYRLRETPHG